MSTFIQRNVACPHCDHTTIRTVAESLNGPRVPEIQGDLLAGTFQVFTCAHCRQTYSYDGPLVYVDFDAGHWIAHFPLAWEREWQRYEADADANYRHTMEEDAPALTESLARNLQRRTVFGLEALREKLLVMRAGLDDVALEVLKFDLLVHVEGLTLDAAQRPRLVGATDDELHFHARPLIDGANPDLVVHVPRARYDEIRGDERWSAMREALSEGRYVDMGRVFFGRRAHAVGAAS